MKNITSKPPFIAKWLLSIFLNHSHPATILADFEEIYHDIARSRGVILAKLWYWFQIVIIIPSFINNSIYWSVIMFRNYLTTVLRNIKKHKSYSFINISGLAIGMACCFLILIWVQDELSFDRFHKNKDNIYRIISDWEKNNWQGLAATPAPLAPAIKAEIPEITYVTRVAQHSRKVFKFGEKVFYEDRGIIADPELFKFFSFPFVKGSPDNAFSKPTDIVITESFALKYFGAEEPIGKILDVEGALATVTGVIKDMPHNSHLQFDFMSSFEFINELSGYGTTWGSFNFTTYVLLQENANLYETGKKITNIALNKECPQAKNGLTMRLQNLLKIHLDAHSFPMNIYSLGDSRLVYLFSVIAFFILLIACVNFMNLSTARSTTRAKEVGMRKTVGAHQGQLIRQFFAESIFMAFISCLVSMFLITLALPIFNDLSGKQLIIDFLNYKFILSFVILILLTGLISGIYPAIILSAFKPIIVLRGLIRSGKQGRTFRRVLVIIQFSLSIILIIGTTVLYKQLHFLQKMELGFDKENIVFIPIKENIAEKYETVKNELLNESKISAVSAHWNFFTSTWRNAGWKWEGADPDRTDNLDLILSGVDFDFFETLNLKVIEGRAFAKEYTTDAKESVIMNESAIKAMGIDSPLGKWFELSKERKTKIVGIVEDVHFQSLHRKIEPRIFFINDMTRASDYGIVLIKVKGEDVTETLSAIQGVWQKFNPVSPFEYHFLDQEYEQLYRNEKRIGTILNYFTFFAILISCLGLFGLASFMAEQKTREIGVRKVLGATVSNIVINLSRDFIRWVLIANVIAWPVGFFVTNKILQMYAYKIDVGVDIYIFSGLLALMVAIVTVSFQAIKTARTNPVDTLKYE